jgi:hypothetical protein
MDKDDAIEQLTAQLLRNVTLRLAQLEAAADRENNGGSAKAAAAPRSSAIKAAAPPTIIQKGDRVNIVNTVNKPRTWNNNLEWDQEEGAESNNNPFLPGVKCISSPTTECVRGKQSITSQRKNERYPR